MERYSGIAPTLLRAQVENTASWTLQEPLGEGAPSWREALDRAPALEGSWRSPEMRPAYFSLMLASHYVTVATFVPTDVDTRIRFHEWQESPGREGLERLLAVLDETDAWDARWVSARVVDVGLGPLSGHDGEWMAVRAGALGRALQLGLEDLADSIEARISSELARERDCFEAVERSANRELDALRVACVIAHNLGDLSRVVDGWKVSSPRADALRAAWVRLGHEDGGGERAFRVAGVVNKAVMAPENHRYIPLRKPRGLRSHRALLLPMGPMMDAWGEVVAKHPSLSLSDRADVLDALLDGHTREPQSQSYLRAMCGIERRFAGGLTALAKELPAKARRLVSGGLIREALGVDQTRFEARLINKYKQARDGVRA